MSATSNNKNLLRSLINASEKASNVARVCRANEELLKLLVQEKIGDEANVRFEHDFKTLADVLIQQTIKHDVGAEFPDMREAIRGEESATFTNALGETVNIVVGETQSETEQCLAHVLHAHSQAAAILAAEVHRCVSYEAADLGEIPEMPADLNYAELGIWIDPIDATAEYISGDSIFTNFPGITSTGLDCVTVLIGVYNCITGTPLLGVISQPFHNKIAKNEYRSLIFWGVCLPDLQAHNCCREKPKRANDLAIFSTSESAEVLQACLDLGYEFAFSAGAGHKALKLITWEVDLYALSKSSTFKWDTCAPHAILRALGGDMLNLQQSIKQQQAVSLTYLQSPNDEQEQKKCADAEKPTNWLCNSGGLLALRDMQKVAALLQKLAAIQL